MSETDAQPRGNGFASHLLHAMIRRMPDWKRIAQRLAADMEEGFDSRRTELGERTTRVSVLPFRSYGNTDSLHVIARVLAERDLVAPAAGGTVWSNLAATFERLASDEVAGARLTLTHGPNSVDVTSDDEGYIHVTLPPIRSDGEWQQVVIQPVDPPGEAAIAEVLVPPPTARIGIISDIDDTIVETNATSLVAMAKTVFLRDAAARMPMEGVAEFYAALRSGVSGDERNPLFYVSSSPWNFYELLIEFLRLNRIPVGPLMLQDYGIDEVKLIHAAHDDHKVAQIGEILSTYPRLRFVLVGDSGQRDPEIYKLIAQLHRERIAAIYIRDVTTPLRDVPVKKIAEEISALGIEARLFEITSEAASHAREHGLIL